jgi:hypothetical protein
MLALGLLAATGCGGGDGLEMFPVRGEVTYKGKPLVRGIVNYLPSSPGARPASGSIQPDGTFVLTTQARDDGAVRGTYDIVVHSYEDNPDAPKTREEIEAQGSRSAALVKSIIPDRYTAPETSGLTDTVDENHSGFKKIELTD